MVSYMKKSLESIIGHDNFGLLPPAEYLAELPRHEDTEVDDCTGCLDPCTEHKEYPPYFNIETDFPILGSVKPYGRHIIIATGCSDWVKKIEEEQGTFAYSLSKAESDSTQSKPWKNMVTNSSLVSVHSTLTDGCDVLVLPDNILVANVTVDKANEFYQLFVQTDLPTQPMDIDLISNDSRLGQMKIFKNPYKKLILLCSHKKRDKKCGITAPILAQEFDHVLREKDISDHDAAVVMVSHVGGHKFAGNVICYINDGTRGIWYGRVKSCHVHIIVEETIINGKIVKDIYRGAMDNSFEKQVKKSFLKW
ncbi:Sucrase/ferredoxin-like-domain-containing protein [Thamnidium elegans]|uniref:Altered inheritance of mitochondria protein 32 n=1 Tax=Thamnidium elegans TaxID=101142 RepID=A0A8H7SKS1_9FUNG|nr:hypothetical protein INT48_006363 [Thamnidium elegans]KAI8048220.1 Sucrase/ferredoxin-like-domain-containing protein [Thamnidium elegans]